MSSDQSSHSSWEDLHEDLEAKAQHAPKEGTTVFILARDRDIWNGSKPVQLPAPTDPKGRRRYVVKLEIDTDGNVLVGPIREDRDIWNKAMQPPLNRGSKRGPNGSGLSPEG